MSGIEKNNYEDMVGKQYGEYVVLKYLGHQPAYKQGKLLPSVLAQCSCGHEAPRVIPAVDLMRGNTKKCKGHNTKLQIGKVYGDFRITGITEHGYSDGKKSRHARVLVECIHCGMERTVVLTSLKKGNVKHCQACNKEGMNYPDEN